MLHKFRNSVGVPSSGRKEVALIRQLSSARYMYEEVTRIWRLHIQETSIIRCCIMVLGRVIADGGCNWSQVTK